VEGERPGEVSFTKDLVPLRCRQRRHVGDARQNNVRPADDPVEAIPQPLDRRIVRGQLIEVCLAVGRECAGVPYIVGGQIASNALAATYYPTTMRSTGVGWALGIGRVGSIVGPLVGGIMISNQVGVQALFTTAAIPAKQTKAAIPQPQAMVFFDGMVIG